MPKDGPKARILYAGHPYILPTHQKKMDALVKEGLVDIGLLVPRRWREPAWKQTFRLRKNSTSVRFYPSHVWPAGRAGGYVYNPITVIQAIRDFSPDLLHLDAEAFSLAAFQMAIASRAFKVPFSLFCWENVDRSFRVRRPLRELVLKTASLIVAGGESTSELLRAWGFEGPIAVVPQFGVDPGAGPTPMEKPGPFIVGFVGRLVPEKGVDVLLQAARELHGRGRSFQVKILGTGSEEQRLRTLATHLKLEAVVQFIGPVPHKEVPENMQSMNLVVLPSRNTVTWAEQFGHVLVEAMAMGIPVVGSECGEIPNVIGREDLLFPQNDPMSLANLLERLISDERFRVDAAEYGLKRVRERYTDARVAIGLLEAWEEVLDRPLPRTTDS